MASSSGVVISLAVVMLLLLAGSSDAQLLTNYYSKSCPKLHQAIFPVVQAAVRKEARMGASLLRLHFHDCFVNGCDGSVLLDDTSSFIGEKNANPNRNSARGFDVIDDIKSAVEKACPGIVSCADVLAISARDSTVLLGGPTWNVKLGRRDSRTASQSAANNGIPPPTSNLNRLTSRFNALGRNGTGDNNLAPLDFQTPTSFDNRYFGNLVSQRGLLHSDQQLFSGAGSTDSIVRGYSGNEAAFKSDFASAMVKMGDISPLTGSSGEIRRNCRRPN
ncbi:Peroxidase 52 [Linum grandiflorum]